MPPFVSSLAAWYVTQHTYLIATTTAQKPTPALPLRFVVTSPHRRTPYLKTARKLVQTYCIKEGHDACGTYMSFVPKPAGNKPPERRKSRGEDNVKMDLQGTKWESDEWINLA
jgi:hypothetical protein